MRRVKISKYAKEQGVTYRTIWNWCQSGKLVYEKSPTNTIFILVDEKINPINEKNVVYCRVSSSENKSNLESQKQRCLDFCAARGLVVSDAIVEVGSGLNDKREKLRKILADTTIKTIIVENKSRLASFETTFIEDILKTQGREILYISEFGENKEQLLENFISTTISYCSKIYGQKTGKKISDKIITILTQNNE
jgi:predicted site-specific integrase-resolvase